MLKTIRNLLEKVINDIDAGNSNIDDKEAANIVLMLTKYTKDNGMSKYEACLYINISRATFDRYIECGKMPKGEHVLGFKELRWYKKDLDECILKMRNEL